MLMNVVAALDLQDLTAPWADAMAGYCKTEDTP
jgi:hypothetical protein